MKLIIELEVPAILDNVINQIPCGTVTKNGRVISGRLDTDCITRSTALLLDGLAAQRTNDAATFQKPS